MSGYVLEGLRAGRVNLGPLYPFVDDKDPRSIALLNEQLVLFGPIAPTWAPQPPPPDAPVGFAEAATLR